ncbi:MAG: TonB-dependent receptor [Flavobacteriaceae bacterium]|nr:TonB-dependent receptor [Flavobacteriaceae bacterium]
MKKNLLRKSAIAVFTLTTAGFYFAQEQESDKNIEEVVLVKVADIAKDRKTPVAVSTIKENTIVEKLGNQEFPEILNTTPSVYATKSGGGFGDSKINIRGFANENIAVMVNGMPVNDMENSKVYWSNWAGISDVASVMQVQRGLGSSKLAISSIGGTINIVTRAADKKKQGILTLGIANNGYHKSLFAYNTGKGENGWSASFLMSRTAGAMYADATDFEGYNYYFALGYQPNKKHDFQITFTGAPQWHQQRRNQISIDEYIKYGDGKTPNRRYNSDWGYLDGKKYAWAVNFYHKPVGMFNWNWKMSDNSDLATVLYASWGRGGGGGNPLTARGVSFANYRLANGLLDIDKMVADNAADPNNPKILRRAGINQHDWYGFLTNFTHKIDNNWNFSLGLDGRYYKGFHYEILTDLLGANHHTDGRNKNIGEVNRTQTYPTNFTWNPFAKTNHEAISYNNDGEVLWGGAFGQLEYSTEKVSAFVQGAISNQAFQRIDHFLKPGTLAIKSDPNSAMQTKTGFKNLLGYNIKGGLNYNINENHNVFGNVGYYEKQPFFNAVYPNHRNYLNPNLKNEKIFGVELGYSLRTGIVNANLNLYRTTWQDRYLRTTNKFNDYSRPKNKDGKYEQITGVAELYGIQEVHKGVELDFEVKPVDAIALRGAFSIGDWFYKGNVTASYFDESNNPIVDENKNPVEDKILYLDGVKVGDAAQLTASLGLSLKPVKDLSFNVDWRYVDRLYSSISPESFSKKDHKGVLQLPSYNLFDLGLSYKINAGDKSYFTLRGNVYNVLDTIYIAESRTNIHEGDKNAKGEKYKGIDKNNNVFFGYGRTWSASLSFNF